MNDPLPPIPTPAQRVFGVRLYNTLGLCATSYRDWFAEGRPHEWVHALDALQQVLTQCKREAMQAAREDSAAAREALPLFASQGEHPCP
jgi:DNA-binding helix-hairpin-helix protein with protein kinase domain